MNFMFPLGISYSQLTFIFFRGVETTNQYCNGSKWIIMVIRYCEYNILVSNGG